MSEFPERRKVLILSVSRKVSLVRAFKDVGLVRGNVKYPLWHVTGQDIDPNAIALKFCDEVAKADVEQGPFDLILPTRDADLKLGTHRASDETIDICTDKFKFYKWCKANGFFTPEVYFVKPRVSSSGKEVECVWQELIDGEEFSVDSFLDWNSVPISIVPRKRIKVIGGESCVTQTVQDDTILKFVHRFLTTMKLVGHNCTQLFKKDGNIYLLENNARLGGASTVSIHAGCLSPLWYLKLINGEKVEPCVGDYKIGLIGKSYTEWSFE